MSEEEAIQVYLSIRKLPCDDQTIIFLMLFKMIGKDAAASLLMRTFPELRGRYNETIRAAGVACGQSVSQLYWQN